MDEAGRKKEVERAETVRRGLDRASESEVLGQSRLSRMPALPAEDIDAAEIWGRRIGRAGGYLALAGLAIWLTLTYFVP